MNEIFTYTDYRSYLKDKYTQLKSTQPVFSYRFFSKRAGFASPNFLKLVIEGKRNLSQESIHRFADVLKLKTKERRFFEILVHYTQAKDPGSKQHYYQQLLEFPEYQKTHHLEKEQYAYLSHWYYPAILELTHLPDFHEEPEWIFEKLKKKITTKEIREALECLQEMKLLKKDTEGHLVATYTAMTTGETARSLASFSFHEQILDQARSALREQNEDEREFAALTMAMNKDQLKKLKEMIRDFRKMIVNFVSQEEKEKPTTVYQLNVGLFSISTTKKGGDNGGNIL